MEEPATPDYYADLGVRPESSGKEIRLAFLKLAKVHHPDKKGPGGCFDAKEFRKVREAQETLCDPLKRRGYDDLYANLRARWAQYHRACALRREQEERYRVAAARRAALAEEARRKAEGEARRRTAEDVQAAREAERERLRTRERAAEERSREAGRRAEEAQARVARERVRAEREKAAEEKGREVARLARERQERVARERLAEMRMGERQEEVRRGWREMRERAEGRQREGGQACGHVGVGWARRKGEVACGVCGRGCKKFSWRCPECDGAACGVCKKRVCLF